MHAQWQEDSPPPPVQYTITFDSHGGSTVQPITANSGTAVGKPADPARNGYTFQGWYSAESGGTLYAWPHTLSGTVTMHARWAVIDYTISYTLNGGTNSGNPATYTIESGAITLADPTRTGYSFGGWYDNANFTGSAVTGIPAGSTENKTFYARWLHNVPVNISVWVNEAGNILVSNADVTISKSSVDDKAVSFSAEVTGAYSGIQWYLNGDPIDGSRGTARSITIRAADHIMGNYFLGVTVTKDNAFHSTDIHFTVIE
jgi:uncharacterized repeat protein (TIGR02543 family)